MINREGKRINKEYFCTKCCTNNLKKGDINGK